MRHHLETLWQDLRYGLRMLRRSPGFTAVAVLSLALGIGANTAIFSVVDVLLLKALPVKNPERLVSLRRALPQVGLSARFPYSTFEQFREHSHAFSGIFAADGTEVNASIDGQAESVSGSIVSGSYFSVLGANARLGRTFTIDDDKPGKDPVVVINYDYWRRRFSLDPSVVGKTVELNRIPFTVIGVMPPDFNGLSAVGGPGFWAPMVMWPQLALKDHDSFGITARLQPGMTVEQARAELNVIYQQVLTRAAGSDLSPRTQREMLAQTIKLVTPGSRESDGQRDQFARQLPLLMLAVGLVLLIACANVANLLLARATARQKEIAVRLVIGADHTRLIRQLLTESVLLAMVGGVLGLLFAWWGSDLLWAVLSSRLTTLNLKPDLRILSFPAAVSLLTGVLFGLAPALRATRVDLSPALKEGGGQRAIGSERNRLRSLLVISQIALSLVLVIGAGLLVRSLQNLYHVDPGFNQKNVLLLETYPASIGYEGAREVRLYQALLERIQAIPGVRSASLSRIRLMEGHWSRRVTVRGDVSRPDENMEVSCNAVAPKFFETMEIPLRLGRDFSLADGESAPKVAIINETMARRYFPDGNPIGKRIGFDGTESNGEFEIVGVARDTKSVSLREQGSRQEVYIPFPQAPPSELGQVKFEVRTAGDPLGIIAAVRHEVQAVEKDLPLVDIGTQAETVDRSLRTERSLAKLTGFSGLLALLLASIGLYGTMSYAVSRRTNELGIRLALGAQRGDVIWLVLRDALRLVLVGMALGLPAALAATRLISSQLFGLTASDPATISLAMLLLLAVAALASYLPARKASRVDLMVALRCE